MKTKKISAFLLFAVFALSSFALSGCFKENASPSYKLQLEVWGVFDDSEFWNEINTQYTLKNTRVTKVSYRKVTSDPDAFEKELLEALVSGKGPDIIFIQNTWVPKYLNKIASYPDPAPYLSTYKNTFVDVVADNFIIDGNIYAFPLYCDSLALYYNKDLLNQAGIPSPPSTWQDVISQTKILTKIDQYGNISQSGIALGRSKDPAGINRASDIVMMLMMQSGSDMYDRTSKRASFEKSTGTVNAGQSALDFYTQFAKGNSEVYSWNSKMDYSVDAFRFGKTAMTINYAYLGDRLKKTDPKLNFSVAPVPQLDINRKVTYANYWGLGAIQNKQIPAGSTYTNNDRLKEAWDYIKFVTTKPQSAEGFDPMKDYLTKSNRPAARKDLADAQKDYEFIGVFAQQAFYAKSWYQEDSAAIDDIFTEMIDNVASGGLTSSNALSIAASRVNALGEE